MVVLVGCGWAAYADVPHGWFLAGSKPAEFDAGLDPGQAYQGHASAVLKSNRPNVDGFGTLMQQFTAGLYAGKRVRLSGFLKTEEVSGWAGLWLRVDKENEMVGFDNMQNRAVKGTTGWHHYEVVLDVPKDATGIALGVLLDGSGKVWLNGA